MKKIIIGLVAVILIGFASHAYACGFWVGCPADTTNKVQTDQLLKNMTSIITAQPIPSITNSQERANIAKRAQLFNSPDKISYIYLVNYGKVMAFFTVKGKVSSLNSYMTPQEQIVYGDGTKCQSGSGSQTNCYAVQAPDIDGSYGENANGIFFFTTEDAYVEWKGDYMMSDQPLKLSTQPELVRQIK